MKYVIALFLVMALFPFRALAEGKIGAAYLADQDRFSGYRTWFNAYEPVAGKFSLGLYLQHEQGPQNAGNSMYGKLGGYYDLTKSLNLSVFGETTHWTSPAKNVNNFDSKRIGVGLEYKLW